MNPNQTPDRPRICVHAELSTVGQTSSVTKVVRIEAIRKFVGIKTPV